ncbi:MAG TPA: gas vesicle protein GvpD P-loop domain-containing protein [Candidatus Lokiarchaeia archaeon]|nr:gas vesicle protein GvpD P-loop domain-containing protein [Candidatus Lokiarchaeia archaeon]
MSRSLANIFDMVDKNPIVYDITLPEFITKIMDLPFGYALLIKGDAGTGKSTLAMEICMQNMDSANLVFVSTRANLEDLKAQYTGFAEKMGEGKIKDLEGIGLSSDKLQLLNVDNDSFLTIFHDFEKVIKGFLENDLETLIEDPNGDKRPKIIVIIDSIEKMIEAIRQKRASTTDMMIYETLLDYTRKYGLKLFIITETSDKSPNDYLVDGIVTLSRDIKTVPDRILRSIEIQKLRNINIDQQMILFTLYQGRFRTFTALKPKLSILSIDQKVKTIHDMMTDGQSGQLSQMFFVNLFQAHRIFLELEPESNEILMFWHVICIIVALLNHISVVYIPPAEQNVQRLLKALKVAFGDDYLRKYFKVGFFPTTSTPQWIPEYMMMSQSKDILEEFRAVKPVLDSMRKNSTLRGNLVVLPLDTIFIKYNHDNLPSVYQTLLHENILTDDDCLLATNLAFREMDPLLVRFAESFSSRILFTMKGIQVAKTQVLYWVKLPRPAYVLLAKYFEKATFGLNRLDIIPVM